MAGTNKLSSHRFIDGLVILLNFTYGLSFVQVWFLDSWGIHYHIPIILINLSMLLLRFGFKNSILKIKGKWLLYVFISIYLMDAFQQLMYGTFVGCVSRLLQLFYIFLFMEYLYNVYIECKRTNNPINRLTESYEFFAVYNIVCIILCALLLYLDVIGPYDNPLKVNSLTQTHYELGVDHYFPGHLSVCTSAMRLLAQYNIPVLTGLTHEPHVLFLLIGPAFFLLLSRSVKKPMVTVILYVLLLMVLLISTAATAIFCFVIVISLDQIYKVTVGENKVRSIFVLLLIGVLSYFVLSSGSDILLDTSSMLTEKTTSGVDSGSLGFSFSMLYYMLTPHSLFGLGNIPGVSGFEVLGCDIGFVSFVLDFLLIVTLFVKAFKLCFDKKIQVHFFGLAVIYFLLHSLKNAYEIFDYQYFSFILVLVLVVTQDAQNDKISTCDAKPVK